MPRKYKRKPGVVPRHISWTESSLALAFDELDKKEKGINEISRIYGISSRTLRRRYEQKNQQLLTQGNHPVLGFENEKRLVSHILKLGDAGFPPDKIAIRHLAYQFAEKMGLKHNFNNETQMAGPQWLESFLERNPEISLKQAEGLSLERAKGLNRTEVAKLYALLLTVLTENDLLDKPDRIFNMDETSVQLNNKLGKVLAKKDARAVKSLTSGEIGETITIIACCNAIGDFLPPVHIIKGVNKKPEFKEGLPPCSKVFMLKKSAYITSDLFYKWLTEHFIPHKPPGKVLLILDGHSSHLSAVDMLEIARDNEVILLCLPSHTTSALQPLYRSVFGPFNIFYNVETNNVNPQKKLNRCNSGQLAKPWIRAATHANAMNGFRGSGFYPVSPNALSDAELIISDIALGELAQERESDPLDDQVPGISGEPALGERAQKSESEQRLALNHRNQVQDGGDQVPDVSVKPFKTVENKPAGSKKKIVKKRGQPKEKTKTKNYIDISSSETEFENTDFIELNKDKALRKRQIKIYSSYSENEENVISSKTSKGKATEGLQIKRSKEEKSITRDTGETLKIKNANSKRKHANKKVSVDDYCVECFENCNFTKSKSDWIACDMCRMLLHETCTSFEKLCMRCGKLTALAS